MSPPNIHLIPRGDDANDNDIIIENISTLDDTPLSLAATVAQEDDNNVIEEDFLSLSSATSATSIASTLSDGASRHHRHHHHGRPRSASLNIAPSESSGGARQSTTNSTPRQRSTPRSLRPRSNPRTRTPMRNPSPLLITGSRLVVDDGGVSEVNAARVNEASTTVINSVVVGNGDENPNSGNETIVRNIFNNTRRHRSRAGSIPEEAEEVVGTIGSTDSNENNIALNGPSSSNEQNIPRNNGTATIIANPAPRVAGHWLAQAATPTTSRNNNNHRSTNPTLTRNNNPIGLSDKQRPSHRKLRRWNNDRFIGTSSEHIHINLETEGGGAGTEQYWREFYMPNYPCDYRSEFAKLSTDETNIGRSVRDRFVRGEVASRYRGGGGKKKKKTKDEEEDGTAWMERTVVSKFHKLGISLAKSSCSGEATTAANNNSGVHDEIMGKKLFQSINNRIQSVVSRSCALGNNGESPSFATQVVTAFESYLVSLALTGSKKDIDPSVSMMGYPPLQPQCVYDLFDRILSSPPRVVIRNRKHKVVASSWNGSNVLQAVVVPAVHFYFPAEYDTNDSTSKDDGQAKPNSAFYRILLYAVCQFHGLESSSTIIVPNRNGKKKKKKRGSNKGGGDVKVVTVQGGVLLAPALKLLDCVSFSE